jgi:hypothetical protein
LENFSIRPEGKVGRVDDAAPFFPVRADRVGVLRDFQAVSNRKSRAGLFHHLFGFVERVDGKADDVGIFLFEFFDMCLEVGYLPDAVGSPDAAVKNDDGIFTIDICWDVKRAAASGWHRVIRKWVAGT